MKSIIVGAVLLATTLPAIAADVPQFLIIAAIGMGANAPVGSVQVTTLTFPSEPTCTKAADAINQSAPTAKIPNLEMRALCVAQK